MGEIVENPSLVKSKCAALFPLKGTWVAGKEEEKYEIVHTFGLVGDKLFVAMMLSLSLLTRHAVCCFWN